MIYNKQIKIVIADKKIADIDTRKYIYMYLIISIPTIRVY